MNKIDICTTALNNIKPNYDVIVTNKKALSYPSRTTTIEEVTERNLIERLKKANEHGWLPGCGLAAIQIGIPVRFAWFKWGEEDFTLLNPEIIEYKGKFKPVEEGCMSIPKKKVMIKRYYKIKYLNNGVEETAKGLKANIIQHEIDHMNGILNIDNADSIHDHLLRKM